MSGRTRAQHPRVAIALAVLVTILWSSSWILIRWGLDDENLPPLTFAAVRYCVAALLLLVPIVLRRQRRADVAGLSRQEWRDVIVLGVVFYGLTQAAQFVAIDNQPAATTSMMLSLTPLLVAGWSMRRLGELPTRMQWLGATLVAVGAALFFAGDLVATVVGMTAATVNLGTNAWASVLGRRVNRTATIPPIVITAAGMTCGGLVLLTAALAVDGLPTISLRGWLIIGWLAAVNTALAFTLWNRAQRDLTALETAGINNTMLIQIAVLAWWFLGEMPGIAGFGGIALVSVGVFLTQRVAVGRPVSESRG